MPLTPGIVYQDNRATREAEQINATLGALVRARTGSTLSHFYIAPKALWLGAHQAHVRQRSPLLVQPRDLVAHRLTGTWATDPTHAGCTGVYDLGARDWAGDWLDALGLGWLRLPPVVTPTTQIGPLTAHAAGEAGLRRGIPIVIGAADNFCADLAMGAVRPGVLGDTSGTSTCLDLTVDHPTDDPLLALYTHLAPGLLFANAGLNATGAVVAWAADALAGGSVARLETLAASVPPDLQAPLLLPYLGAGERTDAAATGVWHGLTLTHDPARLARSVYEGLTFALRDLVDRFRGAGNAIAEARVGGGGSRSHLWNSLKATVWQIPVRPARHPDATALGAALLAGCAIHLYHDLDDVAARAVHCGPIVPPDPASADLYAALYERWVALLTEQAGRDQDTAR